MEVNDYVRTKDGLIGKLMGSNAYDENKLAIHTKTKNDIKITPVIDKEQIIKSSPNIIDLIEAGDYVNGRKIEELYCCAEYEGLGFDESDDSGRNYIFLNEIDIKSIVTKECFERMEYKVGD